MDSNSLINLIKDGKIFCIPIKIWDSVLIDMGLGNFLFRFIIRVDFTLIHYLRCLKLPIKIWNTWLCYKVKLKFRFPKTYDKLIWWRIEIWHIGNMHLMSQFDKSKKLDMWVKGVWYVIYNDLQHMTTNSSHHGHSGSWLRFEILIRMG